jgi:hypothetical protein
MCLDPAGYDPCGSVRSVAISGDPSFKEPATAKQAVVNTYGDCVGKVCRNQH